MTKTTTNGTTTNYTYTPDGQQATKATTGGPTPITATYEWDLAGNLASAAVHGMARSMTTLAHTLDGTRLARTTGAGTTIYLPDAEITYPSTGTPTAIRYYTHAGHTVAIRRSNYTLTWQTTDRQGSVSAQLGDGTSTATRLRYDPYGQPQSGNPTTDRSWLDKTTDPTTGLTHLGHRYYDTTLGRFLTPDPLVDQSTTQTPNPYSYAANNPTHYTDPDGLLPRKPWLDDGYAPPKAKPKYTPPAARGSSRQGAAPSRTNTQRPPAHVQRRAPMAENCGGAGDSASVCSGPNGPVPGQQDMLAEVGALGITALKLGKDVTIGECFSGNGPDCAMIILPWLKPLKIISKTKSLLGTTRHTTTASKAADDWPIPSGIVRDASKGTGNFGLGSSTASQAERAGQAWVGEGYTIASDGKTLVSSNGLRQWRPPSYKPNLDKWQSNFESRLIPRGQWQGNGHLDITDLP